MMRSFERSTPLFLLLAGALVLPAQMPDWKYFRDREGNTYYIDGAGKIRITDVVEYHYRPVSARGIDYYLNYGSTLIQDHRLMEGLTVLKSIRTLPAGNNRIVQAQVRATEIIQQLKRRNGPRFDDLNGAASLLFMQMEDGVHVINDKMYYSFTVPGKVTLIRKSNRAGNGSLYEGVSFGVRKAQAAGGESGAYDFLVAIDSEKYAVRFKNLDRAVQHWKGILGHDGLERRTVEESADRVVYAFSNRGEPRFAGLEAIFVNGRFSHCARVISSEAGYRAAGAAMNAVVKSVRIVSAQD